MYINEASPDTLYVSIIGGAFLCIKEIGVQVYNMVKLNY